MSSSEQDVPIFAGMLSSALGDRLGESATFPAMLAENVEIETSLCARWPASHSGRGEDRQSAPITTAIVLPLLK